MEESSSNDDNTNVTGGALPAAAAASPTSLLVPTYDQWHEKEDMSQKHTAAAACTTPPALASSTNIWDSFADQEDLSCGAALTQPPPAATGAAAAEAAHHPSNSAKMAQQFLGYQSQFPALYKVGGGLAMSAKKRKRAAQLGLVPPPNKNAVVALNELRPGLEYVVAEEKGPIHQPTFVIQITVNGQVFTGEGRSKKHAKHDCAQKALDSFVQFRDAFDGVVKGGAANGAGSAAAAAADFTSDQLPTAFGPLVTTFHDDDAKPSANGHKKAAGAIKRKAKAATPLDDDDVEMREEKSPVDDGPSSAKKAKVVQQGSKYVDKNPVMILNELRPGLKYEVSECGDSPTTKRFVMKVGIDGSTYEGSGASKKLAKQACARSALTCVYNMSFTPHLIPGSGSGSGDDEQQTFVPGTTVPLSEFSLAQPTADRVGKLVMDRFSELISGHTQHSRRKVLAGVVMSVDGEAMDDLTIITVSTGTKCVNGEHMSDCGNALNDCHAEIVSRRCLVDFLYRHLELHLEDGDVNNQSIFVKKTDESGYNLKENIRFHLYINTAPCGDARIFSPHEANEASPAAAPNGENSTSVDRHPNRKARGQLRTKIESGEGTIPVKSPDGIQTWDGVMQGSRLLTMSCSDKVAKWNVLGIQGSLLSHFVDPIYFHSITLGSLFHPNHMFRAVAGRIEGVIEQLPEGFRLNIPRLNLLSSPEKRQPGKAPNYSVNWTLGVPNDQLEIVDAMKGKEQESGAPSRLAKVSFFRRFLNLVSHPEIAIKSNPSNENLVKSRRELTEALSQYSQAKSTAKKYQDAKHVFYQAFKKAHLGTWVKKPMEQDEFQL